MRGASSGLKLRRIFCLRVSVLLSSFCGLEFCCCDAPGETFPKFRVNLVFTGFWSGKLGLTAMRGYCRWFVAVRVNIRRIGIILFLLAAVISIQQERAMGIRKQGRGVIITTGRHLHLLYGENLGRPSRNLVNTFEEKLRRSPAYGDFDPNYYTNKRRVPNGPDPIHNRRAGKSREPPSA